MGFLASCNSGCQATRVSNVTGLLVLRQIPKFCQTNHALNLCQWREPGVTCSDGDTCIEGIHAGQIDFTYRGVFEEGFWLGYTLWEFTPVTPKKTFCDQLASCFDHRTVMQTSVKNQSSSHIWSSTGHQNLSIMILLGKIITDLSLQMEKTVLPKLWGICHSTLKASRLTNLKGKTFSPEIKLFLFSLRFIPVWPSYSPHK